MVNTVKTPPQPTTGIRFTPQDRKLINMLSKKLGVTITQIVRLGLRALATKEGVSA